MDASSAGTGAALVPWSRVVDAATQEQDPLGWVGRTIRGTYRIEAVAGVGGFGIVYRATHLALGAPVAIKCLKVPSLLSTEERRELQEKLNAEGKVLDRLKDTNGIVRVQDAGEEHSPSGYWTPYLVLEWLEGRTLAADIRKQGARSLAEALRNLLDPAVLAIAEAHAEGVSHLDLKPENLFLAKQRRGFDPEGARLRDREDPRRSCHVDRPFGSDLWCTQAFHGGLRRARAVRLEPWCGGGMDRCARPSLGPARGRDWTPRLREQSVRAGCPGPRPAPVVRTSRRGGA